MGDLSFVSFLINLVSQNRPVVIATLCIFICILLLRPGPKPVAGSEQRQGSSPSSRTPRRMVVTISTDGILLRFREGRPQVLVEMVQPLHALAALADVFLITQLPEDSDKLEGEALAALTEAGVFGEGRCESLARGVEWGGVRGLRGRVSSVVVTGWVWG